MAERYLDVAVYERRPKSAGFIPGVPAWWVRPRPQFAPAWSFEASWPRRLIAGVLATAPVGAEPAHVPPRRPAAPQWRGAAATPRRLIAAALATGSPAPPLAFPPPARREHPAWAPAPPPPRRLIAGALAEGSPAPPPPPFIPFHWPQIVDWEPPRHKPRSLIAAALATGSPVPATVTAAQATVAPVERRSSDPARWSNTLARTVNVMLRGNINATAKITLVPNATSSLLRDARIAPGKGIMLMPHTASAQTALSGLYIPEATILKGSCVITHAAATATDQTFTVLILG